jgi:hypothetical protein
MEEGGEIWYEPEALRIEGCVLAADPAQRETARECLERAMKLSHARGQVAFRLRSALALARIFSDDGDVEVARSLVSDALSAFNAQTDSIDVREAQEFLHELTLAMARITS